METIGMFEARTHFSDYVRAAMEGREFIITNRGEEVAMLLPVKRPHGGDSIREALDRLKKVRRANGKLLVKGETVNQFAREGLKW